MRPRFGDPSVYENEAVGGGIIDKTDRYWLVQKHTRAPYQHAKKKGE